MAKVFISYSRKDIEFAKRLTGELQKSDLDFWVDWEGIPPTVDWWREIEKGIEEADVFLFLISPDSAASKICGQEIDCAVKNSKRIIPLVVRDVKGDEAPKQLSHLNWIFFREQDDFNAALQKLLTAIHTDYEWVQTHRRLQVKALEWERINKENSFLLRGKDLSDAELQLATNTSKEPHPTDLQRDYVFKSRQAADRQRGIITGISVLGVIVLAALAVFGFMQAGLATTNANEAQAASTLAVSNASTAQAASTLAFNNAAIAQANEQLADERANIAQAGEFSIRANTMREEEPDLAMLLGIEAFRLKDNSYTRATLQDSVLYQPNLQQYLFGHTGEVNSVAFSPDGKIIASASYGEVILWNAVTGKPISEPLNEHNGDKIAFSPDGKILASGGEGRSIILWDVNTQKPIGQPIGPTDEHTDTGINALEFSPDGKLLASSNSVGFRSYITIWNVETREPFEIAYAEGNYADDIAFNPDGKIIASHDRGGIVILWDTQTGKPIGKPFIGDATANFENSDIAFSPDGKTLASSSSGGINIWNLETHQLIGEILDSAYDIAFTPDGKTLVSSNGDIILWDVSTSLNTGMATYQPIGQPWATGNSLCIDISSDGKTLVSGNEDGTVTLWHLQTYLPIGKSLTGDLENITEVNVVSPNGKSLALVQRDSKAVLLWDIAGQRQTGQLLPDYDISHMAFSPDGMMLATNGSDDKSVILWDLKTGHPIGQPLVNDDWDGWIADMVFSPDSKQLATSGRYARLWSVETHQIIKDLSADKLFGFEEQERLAQNLLAPANNMAVGYFALSKILIMFWQTTVDSDILSDVVRKTPTGGGGGSTFGGISFNPDGNLIAFIYNSYFGARDVVIWDSQKDKYTILPTDFSSVSDLTFSKNGKTLVTTGEQIVFWDTESWKPVGLPITGKVNGFSNPTLSQDETVLAAADGGSIMLWDVRSRQSIVQPIPSYSMSELMFNPADNGKSIISTGCIQGCAHGAVTLWDLDPQFWIEKVCERVGRNFTYNEWELLFPEVDYRTTCANWPVHPTVARGIMEQIFSNIEISRKAKTSLDKVAELLKGDITVKDPISESKRLVGDFIQEKLVPGSTAIDAENIKSMIDLVNEAIFLGLSVHPSTLNNICWRGSIEGYVQDVLPFCEQAVSLEPDNADHRDSRGLARALIGDFTGAILDFQYYVDTYGEGDMVKQRQQWILDLQAGKNPFTPEVLEMLKEQ